MGKPSEKNQKIATTLMKAFGGEWEVHKYWDDDRQESVDMVSCEDSPRPGLISLGTVRASDYPVFRNGQEVNIRTEFVGVFQKKYDWAANVLATLAFNHINSHMAVGPGEIHCDIVSMYDPNLSMKHIFMVTPVSWNKDALPRLEFDDIPHLWLQAIPISESEYQLACERGPQALENLLVQKKVDFTDFSRAPAI